MKELEEVTDWKTLGLYLGVKPPKLEEIDSDDAKTKDRRMQLLIHWSKQVIPTWTAVIKALLLMGMRRLASEVAKKHG